MDVPTISRWLRLQRAPSEQQLGANFAGLHVGGRHLQLSESTGNLSHLETVLSLSSYSDFE